MLYRIKAPKCNKFSYTSMWEKPVHFFSSLRTGVDFSSQNNFTNLVSFAKISVPVGSIIPWIDIPSHHHRLTTLLSLTVFLHSMLSHWIVYIPTNILSNRIKYNVTKQEYEELTGVVRLDDKVAQLPKKYVQALNSSPKVAQHTFIAYTVGKSCAVVAVSCSLNLLKSN